MLHGNKDNIILFIWLIVVTEPSKACCVNIFIYQAFNKTLHRILFMHLLQPATKEYQKRYSLIAAFSYEK